MSCVSVHYTVDPPPPPPPRPLNPAPIPPPLSFIDDICCPFLASRFPLALGSFLSPIVRGGLYSLCLVHMIGAFKLFPASCPQCLVHEKLQREQQRRFESWQENRKRLVGLGPKTNCSVQKFAAVSSRNSENFQIIPTQRLERRNKNIVPISQYSCQDLCWEYDLGN